MHIEHVALWTKDIERSKSFYETYFRAVANAKYVNPEYQFESYFLTFADGPRLEIMQMPSVPDTKDNVQKQRIGYIHIAVSVGSKEKVDEVTELLRADGFTIMDEPRTTGDGYYESVVLDPDENRIEITI